LSHALIDDIHAEFCETKYICFTSTKIAALDGVLEKAEDAVAVVAVVLGGVNACEGRLDVALDVISNGARSEAHATELDCGGDMKDYADEQDDSYCPEQLSLGKLRRTYFPQEPRIRINLVRTRKYLEIS